MKKMKLSLHLDDYETEKIFSYLRWIFLLLAVCMFYVPPFSTNLIYNKDLFPLLLAGGIFYMTITQIYLDKAKQNQKHLKTILKAGIVFDYVALIWLMALTGGVHSPLFPISYLLVMHATIYWRSLGALFSTLSVTIGYSIMALVTIDSSSFEELFSFSLNLLFLWILGVFGAMIMLRERSQYFQKKAYHYQLNQDYLSGLFNHRYFQDEIRNKISNLEPFYLLLGDIDDFKKINDEKGHLVGDQVIREVGKQFIILSDKYSGKAFRYGGEEFAFLLPVLTKDKVQTFLNELYSALSHLELNEEMYSITMSFGQAVNQNGTQAEELIKLADQRLYMAKRNGKNQVVLDTHEVFTANLNHTETKQSVV